MSLRISEERFLELRDRAKKKSSPKKSPKRTVNAAVNISCHAKALALLLRYPVLRFGGVFRGKKIQANQEHWDQVVIFDYFERNYPLVYSLLYATPNGGKRSIKTASQMKDEGVKAGVPDMSLDYPRGIYHGLKLELKHVDGGKPSAEQKGWLNRLSEQGYFCCLAYGADEAISLIKQYASLDKGEAIEGGCPNKGDWLTVDSINTFE